MQLKTFLGIATIMGFGIIEIYTSSKNQGFLSIRKAHDDLSCVQMRQNTCLVKKGPGGLEFTTAGYDLALRQGGMQPAQLNSYPKEFFATDLEGLLQLKSKYNFTPNDAAQFLKAPHGFSAQDAIDLGKQGINPLDAIRIEPRFYVPAEVEKSENEDLKKYAALPKILPATKILKEYQLKPEWVNALFEDYNYLDILEDEKDTWFSTLAEVARKKKNPVAFLQQSAEYGFLESYGRTRMLVRGIPPQYVNAFQPVADRLDTNDLLMLYDEQVETSYAVPIFQASADCATPITAGSIIGYRSEDLPLRPLLDAIKYVAFDLSMRQPDLDYGLCVETIAQLKTQLVK